MIRKATRAAAILVLPLAGLAALWVQSDALSRQGSDWEVPIQGYDPRDLLRGHYVEFTYDWPLADEDNREEGAFRAMPQINHLCLMGDPPVITEAIAFDDPSDPLFEGCGHKLSVQPGSVYGYASLSRGRLYVGQERALELEQGLRETDQRGIVTFRQRKDGVPTPLDIRFRPLTPEEKRERDRMRTDDPAGVEIRLPQTPQETSNPGRE